MAGSNYLSGVSNVEYGLPSSIPPGLAAQASAIVDSYLNRPEGCLYVADANNNPCYMANATPEMTYTLQGAISPGANVSVTVSPAIVRPDLIGEVLILDRGNPEITEACVISATTGNNTITLANVQFNHSSNATADTGMVISEERSIPSRRSITRVSRGPIANVLSLLGRYAYGRRSDQTGGLYQEMNLLASVQTFGGPPQWIPINITQSSWSNSTLEIWVPAGMLLAYYSDAKIKYVAGWQNAPDPLIRATAAIAGGLLVDGQGVGTGHLKMIGAGDARLMKFTASMISADVKAMLDPYRAREFF